MRTPFGRRCLLSFVIFIARPHVKRTEHDIGISIPLERPSLCLKYYSGWYYVRMARHIVYILSLPATHGNITGRNLCVYLLRRSGVVPVGPGRARAPKYYQKMKKWSFDHSRTDALSSTMLQSRLSDLMNYGFGCSSWKNAILWSQDDCRNLLEQCPAAVKLYRRLPYELFDVLYPCDSVAIYEYAYLKKLFHS